MSMDWSSVKALSIPVGGVSRDVKRVTAGGVTLWVKPNPLPYDAEVYYIESTGTQCIDTGWSLTTDDVCDVDFKFTDVSTFQQRIVEQRNGTFGFEVSLYIAGTGLFGYMWQLQEDPAVFLNANVNASTSRLRYTIDGPARKLLAGSSVLADSRNAIPTADGTLLIGSANASRRAYARIYGMTITRDGVLVRDYIPVRVGSGANAVGYLYDRANPTGGPNGNGLYGNSGSGAFVVGPDNNS